MRMESETERKLQELQQRRLELEGDISSVSRDTEVAGSLFLSLRNSNVFIV